MKTVKIVAQTILPESVFPMKFGKFPTPTYCSMNVGKRVFNYEKRITFILTYQRDISCCEA